jgi:ribosomal protein S27AE
MAAHKAIEGAGYCPRCGPAILLPRWIENYVARILEKHEVCGNCGFIVGAQYLELKRRLA